MSERVCACIIMCMCGWGEGGVRVCRGGGGEGGVGMSE